MAEKSQKDLFLSLLNEHLSASEVNDLANMCCPIAEREKSKENIEKVYKYFSDLFKKSNYNYDNFKLNVSENEARREYDFRTWELEDMKMNSLYEGREELEIKIEKWIMHTKPSLTEKTPDFSSIISGKLHKAYACIQEIEEHIKKLKDETVIHEILGCNKQPNEITFLYVDIYKKDRKSLKSNYFINSISHSILEYLKNTRLRTNITTQTLEKEIEDYNNLKKRAIGHFVKALLEILIDNDIIKGSVENKNNYNILDKEGFPIALTNKKASEIYDLCVFVGIIGGKISSLPNIMVDDKRDAIRKRLSAIKNDNAIDYDELYRTMYFRYL